jgi:transposase
MVKGQKTYWVRPQGKQLRVAGTAGHRARWGADVGDRDLGWREIHNGRELGALVGLVPAPFQSSETSHDQGITRAGNKHVRRMMVQLAWSWLHYQPLSALSCWFQERFGGGGRRMRRIGIVALARKLLIALWRYVETGTVPEGAVLKPHVV